MSSEETILDRALATFGLGRDRPSQPRPAPRPSSPPLRTSVRARLVNDQQDESEGGFAQASNDLERWRHQKLDERTLSRMGADELVLILTNISPEISRALWDFVRFCNPGWEINVTALGSDSEHAQGKAAVDAFMAYLGELYGAPDVVIDSMFLNAFLRGAVAVELVIGKNGRDAVDLNSFDPNLLEWRRIDDPERGSVWEMGQNQSDKKGASEDSWVSLDVPTVQYIPIDPLPGNPRGRSLVEPALASALFLLALLHDLRRVVQQQGYPRLDVVIDIERILASMPDDDRDDPDAIKKWVDTTIDEVSRVYSSLQPEDAYVHTDVVTVNAPISAIDSSSLSAVDPLVRALERMIVRGLKSIPLLFGSNESSSETHANRQWEIHAAGIKSLQHLVEQMLGRLLKFMLQVQGIQADVEMSFAELRASEMLRDAQTQAAVIQNALALYAAGHISQDEAAMMTVGHKPDQPAPRSDGTLSDSAETDDEPDVEDGVSGGVDGDEDLHRPEVEDGAERDDPAADEERERLELGLAFRALDLLRKTGAVGE